MGTPGPIPPLRGALQPSILHEVDQTSQGVPELPVGSHRVGAPSLRRTGGGSRAHRQAGHGHVTTRCQLPPRCGRVSVSGSDRLHRRAPAASVCPPHPPRGSAACGVHRRTGHAGSGSRPPSELPGVEKQRRRESSQEGRPFAQAEEKPIARGERASRPGRRDRALCGARGRWPVRSGAPGPGRAITAGASVPPPAGWGTLPSPSTAPSHGGCQPLP